MALIDDTSVTKQRPLKFGTAQLVMHALLGGVAAGAAMLSATGIVLPAVLAAVAGGIVSYTVTNKIPRSGK